MQIDVINAQKTAMIVVDMQNDFVAAGAAMETPAARAMVPTLAEALNICREAQIKAIYTAHVHRRDGCDMGLFDDLHPPIAHRAASRWHSGGGHLPGVGACLWGTCHQEASLQRLFLHGP
jgi:biuret amidohydrolase